MDTCNTACSTCGIKAVRGGLCGQGDSGRAAPRLRPSRTLTTDHADFWIIIISLDPAHILDRGLASRITVEWHQRQTALCLARTRRPFASTTNFCTRRRCLIRVQSIQTTRNRHINTKSTTKGGKTRKFDGSSLFDLLARRHMNGRREGSGQPLSFPNLAFTSPPSSTSSPVRLSSKIL